MAWSFSGLTISSINLNHSIVVWLSVSNVDVIFLIVLSAVLIVLSPTKFNSFCNPEIQITYKYIEKKWTKYWDLQRAR